MKTKKCCFRSMIPLISLILLGCSSMQGSRPNNSVCLDQNDMEIDEDCNEYITNLYLSDPDPQKIISPSTGKSVAIAEFKRPFLRSSGRDYPKAQAYSGYTPFLYNDATELYKIEGNLGSDLVIIFLQGGPSDQLNDAYMQYFEHKFLIAYVLQTNIVKPGLLHSYDLSVAEARQEVDESISFAFEVYSSIKKLFPDKRIALAGHSMGSFLVLKYLAEYDNPFDKVVAMAGRIDMPLQFAYRFAIGQDLVYKDNIGNKEAFMQSSDIDSLEELTADSRYLIKGYEPIGESAILASLGLYRFSNLLEEINLSNMLYVYSDRDESLGGLSSEEISFLEGKKATVRNVGWDEEALGHSRMLARREFLDEIMAFLE